MNKKLKLLLSLVLIVPILLLASCGITQYYTITAVSSEKVFGLVNGGSDVAIAEGNEAKLVASENYPETNPFVCWIKNNNKVVSFDKSYTLTYSSSTQGKYTAFFDESDITKTRYATISNIQIEGVTAGTIEIKYSFATSSSNYQTLEKLQINNGLAQTDKTNLVYFGGADGVNNKTILSFQAVVVVQTGTGNTTYTISFNSPLVDSTPSSNQVTFDNENAILQASSGNGINITLTFTKISSQLYGR